MAFLIKDFVEGFKKAILIDIEHKTVWVVKDGKLKIYSKKYYNDLVDNLNLGGFDDDTH